MTELGHIFYRLFQLRTIRRSYDLLTTTIGKFLTFWTLPPHFLKKNLILFFQADPGPCRYFPLFFPLYDDTEHLKNRQFWWLEMA
jgi:hypothetical protein